MAIVFLIIGVIYTVLAFYSYTGFRSLVPKKVLHLFQVIGVFVHLFVLYGYYRLYLTVRADVFFRDVSYDFFLGVVLTVTIPMLIFSGALLIQDIMRLFAGAWNYLHDKVSSGEKAKSRNYVPSRRKAITWISAGIAAIPFSALFHGITRGKYKFEVKKVKLAFKDLPSAFDGFRIVQISDIHAGSLDSKEDILRGVELVNEQSPDLIVFTGDLVNSHKDEIDPFIEIFKKLKAKNGQFAVLGNHDYHGAPFNTDESIIDDYWSDFNVKFEQMGFRLLNNENVKIEKEGAFIRLLGVENWGLGDWFPQKGDLDKCLEGCDDDDFCILLSHDPTHWDEKVLNHKKHIQLTLSGHTHGMQMGFNLPNFKWSPAQFRYPRWLGLYKESNRFLYVNPGFGFLIFPGRMGIWPEITVFELVKATS